MKHYEHLKEIIAAYFKAKGIDVVLEPNDKIKNLQGVVQRFLKPSPQP